MSENDFNEEKYKDLKENTSYCDELCRYLSIGIHDLFDHIFGLDYHKNGFQKWNCPFCNKQNTTEIKNK